MAVDTRLKQERDGSYGPLPASGSLLNTLSNPINMKNMNPNNQMGQRSQGLKFGTGDNFGIQIVKDNIRSGENKFSNKRTEDLLISDKEHSEGELIEEDI